MSRFQERSGDHEQAEMFALGIVPPKLVLVPCADSQKCEVHNPKRLSVPIQMITGETNDKNR